MFASVVLDYMAEFLEKDFQDPQMAKEAKELQAEIQEGIRKYGIVEDETFGKIYAYETDGLTESVVPAMAVILRKRRSDL